MDVRSIDPTTCWIRHVRRGNSTDPTAKPIGHAYFVREEAVTGRDGINGRQGWQQADCTLALSDDGSFQLVLPNAAGDDGVLHRRRFRCLTDEQYEPGEEWLEFWTDADPVNPLFVGTPVEYEKTKSTITLKGSDLTECLDGAISLDTEMWDGTAPADVLGHYSRVPVIVFASDTEHVLDGQPTAANYGSTFTPIPGDCWEMQIRGTWIGTGLAAPTPYIELRSTYNVGVKVDMSNISPVSLGAAQSIIGRQNFFDIPGPIDLRVVAHYDHVFCFVQGELACEFRRAPPFFSESSIAVNVHGTAIINELYVRGLAPFAGRGSSASFQRRLPGIPPATGLRGRYWNAGPVYAQRTITESRLEVLWPLAGETDPAVERVDATINFPPGSPGYPPNIPGAYAARWTGAIYLDLGASDRRVRLDQIDGSARFYVGKTLRGQEAAHCWWTGLGLDTITSQTLRSWLGTSESGWYPIVVEHSWTAAGIVLQDVPVDGAGNPVGSYAVVPQSRLSPIGCYEDLVRLTPHRNVIGDVSQAFGYQWRLEHRSLESGEFPGQLTFKDLVGRQTEVIIDDDDVGSDAVVNGAAGDVVDGLLADAAGIADPKGSGQLSAHSIDHNRAASHFMLRQAYESLADITERPLLQTRLDSLLVLRSSPNEQVGVRPRGQRDVVDTFPLTGSIAKMDWQPGDGVRLQLDSVDVVDATPRQFTQVSWSPRPDGLGVPTVGFRQRPRSPRAALKRLRAAIYAPRRTYQGGLTKITGTTGNADQAGVTPAVAAGSDGYSRATLPARLADVVSAILCVQSLTGTGWQAEVAGVWAGPVDGVGRYDVTSTVKSITTGAPYTYARLAPGGSTVGAYLVTLELMVRV